MDECVGLQVTNVQMPAASWGQLIPQTDADDQDGGEGSVPSTSEMTSAEFEAWRAVTIFDGTPAAHALWLSEDAGRSPRAWCVNGSAEDETAEGIQYRVARLVPCDGSRRSGGGATEVTLTLDGRRRADTCLAGSGSVTLVRTSVSSVVTSGALAMSADLLACFGGAMPTWLANMVRRLTDDPTTAFAVPFPLQLQVGARTIDENRFYCEGGATPQVGSMLAHTFNATEEGQLRQLFYTHSGNELFRLDSLVRLQVLLVSHDECASRQTDDALLLGFRFGFHWQGSITWNLCCGGGRCAICDGAAGEISGLTPVTFNVHRSLFPGSSRTDPTDGSHYGFCQTDDRGTYRYPCEGSDCLDPIGFQALPGLSCA